MTRSGTISRNELCNRCQLGGLSLCKGIRAYSELSRKRSGPRLRAVTTQTTLVEENENPQFSGILRTGYLRAERILADGRRSIMGFFAPGDLVGDVMGAVGGPALVSATDAEICTLDTAALRLAMREDPDLNAHFIREAIKQHTRQLEMIWRRGALNSRERILAFMVMATEFMPTDPQPDGSLILKVRVSRRDWADFCNTTVETISRTVTYLSEKDMVESLGDGCFRIRDLGVLARLAGLDLPDDYPAMLVSSAQNRADKPRVPAGKRGSDSLVPKPVSGSVSLRN
ncbi:Crp/Fnr family transcriptional regulator [Mameliella sp. AT18]|uniref:Crp/Fnr family transcriptional regulator n=1 Tax=Mameliella sp. AT18 TaxID=3028385 RepID=UPI00237B54D3|nr:Crp/Fnr family transcriptional regulator [Mameliella sp. AT18]MDD9731289.1 Crp/Fnr family transcriptional regulator [Mameliella sp. AT18]